MLLCRSRGETDERGFYAAPPRKASNRPTKRASPLFEDLLLDVRSIPELSDSFPGVRAAGRLRSIIDDRRKMSCMTSGLQNCNPCGRCRERLPEHWIAVNCRYVLILRLSDRTELNTNTSKHAPKTKAQNAFGKNKVAWQIHFYRWIIRRSSERSTGIVLWQKCPPDSF